MRKNTYQYNDSGTRKYQFKDENASFTKDAQEQDSDNQDESYFDDEETYIDPEANIKARFKIIDDNHDPIILSSPPLVGEVGVEYRYEMNVQDNDQDELYFSFIKSPAGMSITADSGLIVWRPPYDGPHHIIILIDDGNTGIVEYPFTIEVGSEDIDEDGIINSLDRCPNTKNKEPVDIKGCSDPQKDSDQDGISNAVDLCPNTLTLEKANAQGCASHQLDGDKDGISNKYDLCPGTKKYDAYVDANGCSQAQIDSDHDLIVNLLDQCPNTKTGSKVDANGCTKTQMQRLNITSHPITYAQVNQPYRYQVRTNDPLARFEFDVWPNGMKLTRKGLIKWTPSRKDLFELAGGATVIVIAKSGNSHVDSQKFIIIVSKDEKPVITPTINIITQ